MGNFEMGFSNPWLLLLLIPAAVLLIITFFRVTKRYRYTRNRIVSLVLLSLVMLLSVGVLAGVGFTYAEEDESNELIILVDKSYSTRHDREEGIDGSMSDIDAFIYNVINSAESYFAIGIVTFGRDQVLAAPLSRNHSYVWSRYTNAPLPDYNATDIAAALLYARNQFAQDSHGNSLGGRILLISNGLETDGSAMGVIGSLVRQHIRVDTKFFGTQATDEFQIVDIVLPDVTIEMGDLVNVGVVVESDFSGPAYLTLLSHNQQEWSDGIRMEIMVTPGRRVFTFNNYSFETGGLQVLRATIDCVRTLRNVEGGERDTMSQNNIFYRFFILDNHDNMLVLYRDRDAEEILHLMNFIEERFGTEDAPANLTALHVDEAPTTIRALREFDKVILANVGGYDMPAGFSDLLYIYVRDHEGGVFVMGGDREIEGGHTIPNVFNRLDMQNTPSLNRIMPVDTISWTPPLAVMLVIDVSGSMSQEDVPLPGVNRLQLAQQAAVYALGALNQNRDYFGIIAFDHEATLILNLTSMRYIDFIESRINGLQYAGGTEYEDALRMAGMLLQAHRGVDRRHIMFLSDGQPTMNGNVCRGGVPCECGAAMCAGGNALFTEHLPYYHPDYQPRFVHERIVLDLFRYARITTSGVGIMGSFDTVFRITRYGRGRFLPFGMPPFTQTHHLPEFLLDDLASPPIVEGDDVFDPLIDSLGSVEFRGINPDYLWGLAPNQSLPLYLEGFYGTRLRAGATRILMGPHGVALHARWRYTHRGAQRGRVAALSTNILTENLDFWECEISTQFLYNALRAVAPTRNIRVTELEMQIGYDNFTRRVNVFSHIGEGDGDRLYLTVNRLFDYDNSYTNSFDIGIRRLDFQIWGEGIYHIRLEQRSSDGVLRGYTEGFTAFSYSKEFDAFVPLENGIALLGLLAEAGRGNFIEEDEDGYVDISPIFAGAIVPDNVEIDPGPWLILAAIILFLIDIAARKFKWKWPWEVANDRRKKRELEQQLA
ncbi:MAG: VWA domain-containing protein [Firmicutes bacterium]|nr:VWA domain-containing protein [Bacillota bacterium]